MKTGAGLLVYNITGQMDKTKLSCLASNGKSDFIELDQHLTNSINSLYSFNYWNPKNNEIDIIELEDKSEPCPHNCQCFLAEQSDEYDQLHCANIVNIPTHRSIRRLQLKNSTFSILESIKHPAALIELKLENSKINTIPTGSLKNFTNISYLNLNGNNLTVIPTEFKELKALESLSIANNKIETPDWNIIKLIENITFLNLTGNSIQSLPTKIDLERIEKIKNIDLRDNKQIECPCQAVLSYPDSLAEIVQFDCHEYTDMKDIQTYCQQAAKSNSGLKE